MKMFCLKKSFFALLLPVLIFGMSSRVAADEGRRYLRLPTDPAYPPYDKQFTSRQNAWPAFASKLAPTVPVPGQWPYVSSWPYVRGWSNPNWWPYSTKWDYNDRNPYSEWWSNSDWLAYKDRWGYGSSSVYSDRWAYPGNWPYPQRWSPTDQWPSDWWSRPSTADVGAIDMLNDRNEAIAFGDYTFQLDVGDAAQNDNAPEVSLLLDDGRVVSYNHFLPRDYWRGDYFTLRRNGQNVGTARLASAGYGYAVFQPAEGSAPLPGDQLVHHEAPQSIGSIMKSKTLVGAQKTGVFAVEETNLQVEPVGELEANRQMIKKLKKPKDWPDTDIWWEDTSKSGD